MSESIYCPEETFVGFLRGGVQEEGVTGEPFSDSWQKIGGTLGKIRESPPPAL